jgi:FkbM family methyltransferase
MRLSIGRTSFPAPILQAFQVSEITVKLDDTDACVRIRLGQTDAQVFHKVFLGKEYDLNLPQNARTIVDAGANVGYAAVWFAMRYPGARVIAIEPDEENFAILRTNCASFPDITCVFGALWSHDTTLELRRNAKSWGSRTVEGASGTVPAYSLNTIMREHGLQEIDILKVDIEGAEKEVFSAPDRGWLDRTGCIAVETHDRFMPGSRAAVHEAAAAEFTAARKGENEFFYRKTPRAASIPEPAGKDFEHIWLVSDGRSGSTWLESLIGSSAPFASYFEPMHATMNPALKGEPLVRYIRPGQVPQKYIDLYQAVFSRQFRHKRAGPYRPQHQSVVVKDIHALMSARAISAVFPSVKVVCLVRHPVDVAKSKMRLKDWLWLKEPSALLDQAELHRDWLKPFEDTIKAASSQFEKYVAIWCAMYFVFARQFEGSPVDYVRYDDIAVEPNETLSRVFANVKGEPRIAPPGQVLKRSVTDRPELGVMYDPSEKELHYAECCLDSFGLHHLLAAVDEAAHAGSAPRFGAAPQRSATPIR